MRLLNYLPAAINAILVPELMWFNKVSQENISMASADRSLALRNVVRESAGESQQRR